MTNFIPVFPLELVVYPGEDLNLHIFEPRYRQLIQECWAEGKPFGIPAVVNNRLQELGTLVTITDLRKVYDDGRMDISTRGLRVFRMLELVKQVPDKLYSGAIVTYPDDVKDGNPEQMQQVLQGMRRLHRYLQVEKQFRKEDAALRAFDIAHHVGLSLEEEYELLGLFREAQRQEYLKRHLNKALPLLAQMEALKEKVRLNGHFRNLEPFNFDF